MEEGYASSKISETWINHKQTFSGASEKEKLFFCLTLGSMRKGYVVSKGSSLFTNNLGMPGY